MPLATDLPDFRRPDAATVLVSAWLVPDAGMQRPAADAVLAGWEHQRRPDAMLALSAFLSTDGGHVLNYAQWTDDAAHLEWAHTRRPAAVGRIDEALPGIRRPGLIRYRRHRSHVPEAPAATRPAFLTTPAFATTGPDAQRALADTVVGMLDRERVPGLLGAHLHLSRDGDRVLNIAEWADADAWREFTAGGAADRLRAAIGALPGVTPVPAVPVDDPAATAPAAPSVARYRLHGTVVNIPSPRSR
ncbi:antibiotic biosynthesis monooxygenase [Streptomyces sp. GS7]|uniref:antibiotic biosynthesis monooxygenase n=1 Tax=Streptomyces sp. GS7 TaxID=2692234 RepID=UPI001315B897|nr:antibiotic biosynthesis monooxygenase [Streptomyces sp. GS7]QHC25480.1 antibiotic biosynthesis monooxygenase [Streptomyces sp. GS7]